MGVSLDELLSVTDDIQVNLAAFDLDGLTTTTDSLSDKEIQLVDAYRKATPDDRQIVDLTLKKYMVAPCIKEDPAKAVEPSPVPAKPSISTFPRRRSEPPAVLV